jgi:phosphatidylglycerophosphate synthase
MRSDTGIVFNHGADFAKNAIDVIERVEVHNCSFFLLMKLWSGLGLDKVCSRFFRSLKLVQNLPSSFFHAGCNITGGSDAHHVWDVGDYMEVVVENFSSIDRTALFEKVLNNKNDNFFINKNKPLYGFPVLVATVLRELFMKKATLYTIDNNEEREYLNCFSKAEKKSAKKFATLRTILFDPILFVLHKLRITPDTLTLSGLFLMLGFVYFLPINVFYAIACVLGHICLDGLDGALARYQQRSSDRGALLDIVVDQGVLVIGVLTAIYFNLISGFWGALYCTMYVVFITLIVVLNRMGQSIKYIFRSKYFFFVLLFVDLIKNTSMLIWFLPAVGIYMVAMCVYLLHRLRLELN